ELFSEYPAPYGAPLFPKGEFGAEYPAFLLFYSPFIERGVGFADGVFPSLRAQAKQSLFFVYPQ
ncbi:MAG: hypothetical protein ACP5QS_02890, partial [bacterium]